MFKETFSLASGEKNNQTNPKLMNGLYCKKVA